MSVLSRERAPEAGAGDPGGLRYLPRPLVRAGTAVVPIAKRAGMTARDGALSAAAWAAPQVDGARAWTAPRIEWTGLAIRDTVGPRICEVLVATARRVEVTAPRADAAVSRRRWMKATAVMVVLAAAGAGAAAVLQRRKAAGTSGAPGGAEAGGAEAGGASPQTAPDGQPRAEADGHAETDGGAGADDSRPSPAA